MSRWIQKEGSLPYQDWPSIDKAEYPEWMWIQRENQLPQKRWPPLYTAIPWVRQSKYVMVYDYYTKQEHFMRNGDRILCPSSVKITEELNGMYELELVHPIDESGAWEYIREMNIIRAQDKLFTIYNVKHSFEGGKNQVTAKANAIFYQQADGYIFYADIKSDNIKEAIEKVWKATETYETEKAMMYTFQHNSDINKPIEMTIECKNPVEAIMGNSTDGIMNLSGGELYRDNFYWSLNSRMEGAIDDAFEIRCGLNMTGIEREVDYSSLVTYLVAKDNFNHEFRVSYFGAINHVAHHVIRQITFNYSEDPGREQFVKDAQAYYGEVWMPSITYTIKVEDLRYNPDYQNFKMFRLKVGDTGHVYDSRLGIDITAKIIRTVTDGITGKVTEVILGNTPRTLTRANKFGNQVTSGATAADPEKQKMQEEIKNANLRFINTWSDMSKFHVGESKMFLWREVKK